MEKFENLTELILALVLWITSNTEHIKPENMPVVKFIEQTEFSELACGRECEILALTPNFPKNIIYLSKHLDPLEDVCHRAILMHELIHILQENEGLFNDYNERTKKHLREMNALVLHNVYLSQFGKKILYSNGFAAKLKTTKNTDNLYC